MPVHVNAFSFSSIYQRACAFWSLKSQRFAVPKILTPLCVFVLLLVPDFTFASMVNQPVSVFSTYPSETLLRACGAQRALSEAGAATLLATWWDPCETIIGAYAPLYHAPNPCTERFSNCECRTVQLVTGDGGFRVRSG